MDGKISKINKWVFQWGSEWITLHVAKEKIPKKKKKRKEKDVEAKKVL